MKCLVTGAGGFIGSHLTERLLSTAHEVVAVDDFSNGSMDNLNQIRENPKLSLHVVDLTGYSDLRNILDGVELVFHLAAVADIVDSVQNPLRYHRSNVDGTVAILEAAREAGVKKFLYAASSSCYGIPECFPTPETAPTYPLYPYAVSKFVGEQYVMYWNRIYGLPCVSLRLFNVYGPRSRTSRSYGAVLGVFMAQKLAGKPMTIVGDGRQTRDFTFVSDVVDAFLRAADSDADGEIFNVGSGGTYSINYLAELLAGDVIYLPKRPGEPDCTYADISKIQNKLSWYPQVSFESGVKATLACISQWKDAPVWDAESISDATKSWFDHLGN